MLFLDQIKLFIEAGDGGNGCLSFRREKYVPRGGPNGGNGGNGGSVYLIGSKDINTFYKLSHHPHCKAERGQHGKGSNQTGGQGNDISIPTPIGTVVYEISTHSDAQAEHAFLGELLEHGQTLCVALGGKGGRGNASFKSSTNRAPRRRELGQPGEKKTLYLELKLLANVGLIGFPNAGKSSLLSYLTKARPKIASYPFTTINPVLGACHWKETSFVIADIPGLIEGAHQGRGLGDEFLRHVERTSLLIHLVDPQGYDSLDPKEGIRVIERELNLWDKSLIKKPRLIVINKSDTGNQAEQVLKILKKNNRKVFKAAISAHTGKGVDMLCDAIIQGLKENTQ